MDKEARNPVWPVFLIIAAGIVVYLNSFSGVFLFDDNSNIVRNEFIRRFWPIWKTILDPSQEILSPRPVLYLSFATNYALGGLQTWGYHAVNLAIHILAALVLFGILRRTFLTNRLRQRYGKSSTLLALAIALIWIVHPLQTQCVTYIIQRAESLMGLFYLLTLYAAIRTADSVKPRFWSTVAMISCIFGMLTKEVMVTCPLIVLIYDRIFISKSFREIFKCRWKLYLGLMAGFVALALFLMPGFGPRGADPTAGFVLRDFTPLEYAQTQPGVILYYLKLAFWPHPLVLDYYWPIARSLGDILPQSLALGGLILLTLWALIALPAAGFLGAWFFLILLPSSSIVSIADPIFEHRMYLSLIAVIAFAVLGVREFLFYLISSSPVRRVVTIGLMIAVVCTLGVMTIQRNKDYYSEVGMWLDAAAKRPKNPRPHDNLGFILSQHGMLDDAVYEFSQALRLNPQSHEYRNNLGNVLKMQGKLDEAITYYKEALQLKPDFYGMYNNLGNIYKDKKDFKQAKAYYAQALHLKPNSAQLHNNMAIVLMEEGDLEGGIAECQEALRLKEDYSEAHNNLGIAFARAGRLEEAKEHFSRAIQLAPDFKDPQKNLSVVLASEETAAGQKE